MGKVEHYIALIFRIAVIVLLIITINAFYQSCKRQGLDPSPGNPPPKTTGTS